MKKFILFVLLGLGSLVYSQVSPQLINYQGVARSLTGQPITGVIGVKVEIHQGSATGPISFTEVHNVLTNQFGIFNIQIGKVNTTQFPLIDWSTGSYFIEVSIDPAGGTSYSSVSNQQLISVPYALYADKAKNASQTQITASSNVTVSSAGTNTYNLVVPNYVAGNNVTITPTTGNNYVIDAANSSTSSSVPYSLTVNAPNTVINSANSGTLNIVSPNITITGGGGSVTTNALPNYVLNIPTVAITPTPGGLSVVQGPFSYTVGVAGGPWLGATTNVILATSTNNVGVGTNAPVAKLEVSANPASTNNAIAAYAQQGNGILATTASTNAISKAVIGSNSGDGEGVYGTALATSTVIAGVHGQNTGGGAGVAGDNTSANASPGSHGVRGEANSTSLLAAGVYGKNWGNGAGVFGENTSAISSNGANGVMGKTSNISNGANGVLGENSGNGAGVSGSHTSSGSSANGHGVNGITYNTHPLSAGVNGVSYSVGSGVMGVTSSSSTGAAGVSASNTGQGHGVYGQTTSNNGGSAGVYAVNNGGGQGMYAISNQTNSATGHGIYAITNSNNTQAAGVKAQNNGINGGAGVFATTTSSVAPGVYGENYGLGNGVFGRANSTNSSVTTAGVQGNHYGAGYGVLGMTNSSNSYFSAVYGQNNGAGSGVMGLTSSSDVNSAGVYGLNNGTGVGVKASLPTGIVAGGLNAALLVENGHIKTVGAVPTHTTYNFSGFTAGVFGLGGSMISANDIKGTVTFYTPNGFTGVVAGAFIEQTIAFAKPYNTAPTVVITPQVDMLNFEYLVKNISTAGFTIRVYRSSNSALPTNALANYEFKFNYIVIE
jgi:hypothetical protein